MNGARSGQSTPSGAITVRCTDDGHVLHLSGDVDDVAVGELTAAGPVDLSRIVAVDVGETTYIDSTGLTLIVHWAQEATAAGRPPEIRRCTPRFKRVLEVAGLADMFVHA